MRNIAKIAGVAVPIIIGIAGAQLLVPLLPQFTALVQRLGAWAPLAFIGAYIVVVVCMMPAFLLILVGGAVFGMVKGTMLSMLGALLGGTAAFLIGRHVARDAVAQRVARNPALSAIDRVVGEDGMKIVFLLRLSTAVPFVLSNYALGVTRVRLKHFVLGTFGLIPTVLTYAAYGSASAALGADGKPPVSPVVMVLGVVATIVLGILLARIAQKAIREASEARALQDAALQDVAPPVPSDITQDGVPT